MNFLYRLLALFGIKRSVIMTKPSHHSDGYSNEITHAECPPPEPNDTPIEMVSPDFVNNALVEAAIGGKNDFATPGSFSKKHQIPRRQR